MICTRPFAFFVILTFFLCSALSASDPVDFFDDPSDSSQSASSSDGASSGSDSGARPAEKASGKFAVLVGVDEFEDPAVGSLQYTVQDIEIIYDQLLEIGFEKENIFVLKSHSGAANKPTQKLIQNRIDRVFELAGPNDLVFFAFSGHGLQIDDTIYFCAEDTYASDKETARNTAVSVSDVIKRFDTSPARFKWLVIDACRYNPFSRGAEIPGSRGIQNLDDPPRGTAVMLSCAPGELSGEDKELKHGLFTYSFVEGLKGAADADSDGALTLYELAKYTKKMTEIRAEKRHHKQHPYLKGENCDFIIVDGLLKNGLSREVWSEADACFDRAGQYRRARRYEEAKREIDHALDLTSKADPPTCSERQKYFDEADVIEDSQALAGQTRRALGVGTWAGEQKTIAANGVAFTFRWCPPGEFEMGSPESEEARDGDELQHHVTLTKGFWLLESELTQEQWRAVWGTSKDGDLDETIGKGARYPMYRVDWNESQEFCRKLSELTGERVQLPTESQWEYACRAGSKGSYGGTGKLGEMGWYDDNSGSKTHEVKGKTANAWGLYDMHGNVWEWCSDWKGAYPSGAVTDPAGPSGGSTRVLRGGGWYDNARVCRSACRFDFVPSFRFGRLGLRPAVVPVSEDSAIDLIDSDEILVIDPDLD